jgi:hypothetical protein
MKIIGAFLLVTLMSLSIYADVGNAYRYKATIALNDGIEITGYFYFTTYEKKFNPTETDFTTYIFSYYHFPISLYKDIKTIKVNKNLTVDFAIAGSETQINIVDITNIKLLEEIETEVGSRLREVSKEEFEFLNQDFISSETIHDEFYSENCNLYLLSWANAQDLIKIKSEISEGIDKLSQENNIQEISIFIDQKKNELSKVKIILFNYCSAL